MRTILIFVGGHFQNLLFFNPKSSSPRNSVHYESMSDVEVVEIPDREEGLDELGDDSLLQELPKNLDRLSPPPKPLTSIEIDQLSSIGKLTSFFKYKMT